MAQVPYDPTPQVAPGGSATPYRSINVSADMFGAGVGQAMSHLGQVEQSAGTEIFARGLAMQDLYNHSEAQQASADYMQKAGELHANYSSLSGKDAVDAYPKYIQELQDVRKGIRNGLSNDMSGKLFDTESLSTMGRTIFNGAGHAASENKRYALGASKARIDAAGNQALAQPNDEEGFKQDIATTQNEVRQQGVLNGWAPEQTDNAVKDKTSDLYAARISGMAKGQPFEAQKLLTQATKDGLIRGDTIAKLTNLVQGQTHSVGARQISSQVMSGSDLSPGAKPVDIKQAQIAIGTYESQNNYGSKGPEVFDRKTGASRGQALGRYQIMPENLQPWLAQAGLPAMSQGEFLKSPSAQDQVFNTIFKGYMDKYGSFNSAAQAWFAGEGSIGKDVSKVSDMANGQPGHTVPQYLQGTNAVLAKNMPLSDKVNAGLAKAGETIPDDPLFKDYVEQRIITDDNRNKSIKRDDEQQNRNTIDSALVGGQGPDAKIPTSVEELTSTPEAEAAWNRLGEENPAKQRQYLNVLARNAKGDVAMTPERLRSYQQLKGEAQIDPKGFLEKDVTDLDLPMSVRKELVNLQGKLSQKAEGDPRVAAALNVLKPQLIAAGLDNTKANKEDLAVFTGTLQDRLSQYQDENKKPPNAEQVRLIGSQLLQEQITSKGFLWDSKSPMFKIPVPEDEAPKIKELLTSKNGFPPSDDAVQRFYSSLVYNRLYGKTKAPQ